MRNVTLKRGKRSVSVHTYLDEKTARIRVSELEVFRSKLRRRLSTTSRSRPPLRSLVRIADLFGIGTRKAIKAMAGDYDVEIRRLRRERRSAAAKWNVMLAWGTALSILLRSPFTFLLKAAKGLFSGN